MQIHFEVITMLGFALTSTFSCAEQQARRVTAAQKAAHFASAPQRRWIYDTGCSASSIGRAQLTKAEKARTFSVAEMIYNTACGQTVITTAVECDIPFLGRRQCYVLDDSVPLVSASEDIINNGHVFIYTGETGPYVQLSDGTTVYLHSDNNVFEIDSHCRSTRLRIGGESTETLPVPDTADSFVCQPCLEPGGFSERGGTPDNAKPTKACKAKDCSGCSDRLSYRLTSRPKRRQKVKSQEPLSDVDKNRRWQCYERKFNSAAPALVLKEDEPSIGKTHRSTVRSESAKSQTLPNRKFEETLKWEFPPGLEPMEKAFFIEMFSGSGRMAEAVLGQGVAAYEYDLNKKGGYKNLLDAKVLNEVKALLKDPNCVGIWFGFPCGTFSSARRYDGGPPPLRGNNTKDIWGFPHLEGTERNRVKAANKLLLRMHELMKICEKEGVPFYLENPQKLKLWNHPLISKWTRHPNTTKVEFDYCQFGTDWKKPTSVLCFNNARFNTETGKRCKETYDKDKRRVCSKTLQPHEVLDGKTKGKYKTAIACPYPQEFCSHLTEILANPTRVLPGKKRETVAQAMAANHVMMQPPPKEHYLTHLPKHPVCKACNNCKVQRKHCRDKKKDRKKKRRQK